MNSKKPKAIAAKRKTHPSHADPETIRAMAKVVPTKPLGILEPMSAREISTRKVNLCAQIHRWRTVADSLCYCFFVPWTYGEIVRLVNATTGWNISMFELMLLGERAMTMGRAFNIREGFTLADDRLPKRFFPAHEGYLRGGSADDRQPLR